MAGETGGKARPAAAAVAIRTGSAAPFTASTAIPARKTAETQDVAATTRGCPALSITPPHSGRLIAVHQAKAAVTMPAVAYDPRSSSTSTIMPSGAIARGSRPTTADPNGQSTSGRRSRLR
jgi:hypothetical protein